jgi:hypothetical protein
LKFTLKHRFLSVMTTSKKIHWQSCAIFHKKHFSNAPKWAQNAGSTVLGVHGNILMETRQNKS